MLLCEGRATDWDDREFPKEFTRAGKCESTLFTDHGQGVSRAHDPVGSSAALARAAGVAVHAARQVDRETATATARMRVDPADGVEFSARGGACQTSAEECVDESRRPRAADERINRFPRMHEPECGRSIAHDARVRAAGGLRDFDSDRCDSPTVQRAGDGVSVAAIVAAAAECDDQ